MIKAHRDNQLQHVAVVKYWYGYCCIYYKFDLVFARPMNGRILANGEILLSTENARRL